MTTAWHLTASVLDEFARTRPRVELTLLEGYAGTLRNQLQDAHIDALITPSGFDSADRAALHTLALGAEPWVVLVGERHRLAGTGSVHASELGGENVAITQHRDAAHYDGAVAGLLEDLGVRADLTRAAPGPSLQAAVATGDAIALTTAPAELHPDVVVRPLEPRRTLAFELLLRDAPTSPALAEFVRLTGERVDASARARPSLAAVA
jgi:hypothetical protein